MSVQTLTHAEVSSAAIAIFEGCGKQELRAEEVISLIDDIRLTLKTSDFSVLPQGLQTARSLAFDARVRRNGLMCVKVETLINASK